MYMTRMVLIKTHKRPTSLEILNRNYDEVVLSTNLDTIWPINNHEELIPAFAKIKINESPVSIDGYWKIPEKERKKCEDAIEFAVAALSISQRTKKQIFSAFGPTLIFHPETNEENEQLIACNGYLSEEMKISVTSAAPQSNFDWHPTFSDRKTGAFLMRDALSHDTYSGKFRDYIRLFENAFTLSTKELPKKLSQFLLPELGYTRDEVNAWTKIRDPLSHADNKKNNSICHEGDVAPYIDRVEQAAYDVIFNKKIWGSNSTERRKIWHPESHTTNSAGECVVRPGSKFTVNIRDRFNIYPVYIHNNFRPYNYHGITDSKIGAEFSPIKCTIGDIECLMHF